MAEYIDRDAFLTQERAWYCENCDMRKNSKGKMVYEIGEAPCRACYVGDILDDVENCPAADVVERKVGKWLKSAWSIRCSECGYDMPFAVRNFCPNCGAQMIGGDDDV